MDLVLKTISYSLTYLAVGGVAAFIGSFIGARWKDPSTPKWSLMIGIVLFGLVLYNLHDFLAAFGSNAEI